ncbi:MAG: ThiF family adenylyltransferase [Aestuariivita sp.]|nr:ThiF family adenylyltransferase [Aestuariivita sp.]
MKLLTLAMTKRTHESAFQYLFPKDGLEAAGVFICNQGTGKYHQRLVAAEFVGLPHELSDRHVSTVTWPFGSYFSPDTITNIDRSGQSVITVHSHPNGDSNFSGVDDGNDRALFSSVNAWFDDERINGSAIMLPDGSMVARSVDGNGQFRSFRSVNVVGDNILIWSNTKQSHSTSYEKKLSQTFGKGTLDRLRAMRVGVVGCSGTGSILIELLTRNCVGQLVIVDDDVLEEKNLNRIINGSMVDAKNKLSKVDAISRSFKRIGLGTQIDTYKALTDSSEVVSALVDCDVIFGCVDSAFGRYHLECIASAYLIPYFDVGVHIEADGTGNISAADAVSHYIQPDGRDLFSRGAYHLNQVKAENCRRVDPEYYERQRIAGYLAAVGEEQPAVMSVNMQAACMAFNDFIARVHDFRFDPDRQFATQRFRLVHGCFESEADDGEPHNLFKRHRGAGDNSQLVKNNIPHV